TVAAVVDADFPAIPGGRLREARDLAALDPGDWAGALRSAAAPIPAGTTLDAYARTRAMAAVTAFPEDALRHRAPRIPSALPGNVDRFQELLRADKGAFDRNFDELDIGDVPDREVLRSAHTEVRELVNTHPGLGLRAVLTGEGPDAAATVAARIGWVSDVLA